MALSKYDTRVQDLIKCPSDRTYLYNTHPSADEIDLIKRYSKHTWLYNDNLGRDAVNLKHGAISVKTIAKINNNAALTRYQRKLSQLPNCSLPQLPYKIRTQTCHGKDRQIIRYGPITGVNPYKELLLFHGTKIDNVHSIVQNGFSMQRACGGAYGRNIYFTDSMQKADQYADQVSNRSSGELAMILARVAPGNMVKHGSGAVGHSTIGGTALNPINRFYEIMVPNEDQCYPAYVIIYKRN